MFTLTKEFTFEAAHKLPHHNGKCRRLHGHSFRMKVEVAGSDLHAEGPSAGMLMDFYDISLFVKPLLEGKLDHYYLNESTGLESPTSEKLAYWIFTQLKPSIPRLAAVTVYETCTSSCRFCPGPRLVEPATAEVPVRRKLRLTSETAAQVWQAYQDTKRSEREGFASRWSRKLNVTYQSIHHLISGWSWNGITGLPYRSSYPVGRRKA